MSQLLDMLKHQARMFRKKGSVSLSTLFQSAHDDLQKLTLELEVLKRQPPKLVKNRYGVDVPYFKNVVDRTFNNGASDYTHSELARVFARLAKAADESVLLEPEFSTLAKVEVLKELRLSSVKAIQNHWCTDAFITATPEVPDVDTLIKHGVGMSTLEINSAIEELQNGTHNKKP